MLIAVFITEMVILHKYVYLLLLLLLSGFRKDGCVQKILNTLFDGQLIQTGFQSHGYEIF